MLLNKKFLSDRQGELDVRKKENAILLEIAEATAVIRASRITCRGCGLGYPISIHFEASS